MNLPFVTSRWCEHCRDHYPPDHYGAAGDHQAGPEFGPYGLLLAYRALVLAALQHAPSTGASGGFWEQARELAQGDNFG